MKNKYDLESLYVSQIEYNNSNRSRKEGVKYKTFKNINLLTKDLYVCWGTPKYKRKSGISFETSTTFGWRNIYVLCDGINRNKYKQVCMYNVECDDMGLKSEIRNKI